MLSVCPCGQRRLAETERKTNKMKERSTEGRREGWKKMMGGRERYTEKEEWEVERWRDGMLGR